MPTEHPDYDGPRTVTDDEGATPDPQMTLLGLVVAVLNALVLLPLVPVLALAELVERVAGGRSET